MTTPGAAAGFRGVVAVDGPSGAGKSTVSRLLALRLGARYLDTGAMYRAATWAVLNADVPLDDPVAVAAVVRGLDLDIDTDPAKPSISVGGTPVNDAIRSSSVTQAVSTVAAVADVRLQMVQLQRDVITASGAIVVEGRDIGTAVAPEARVKVFLTASADARAGRRSTELGSSGPGGIAATAADLNRRDVLDSTRAASPLQAAKDAHLIDTTRLAIDEVVDRMFELATGSVLDADAPAP